MTVTNDSNETDVSRSQQDEAEFINKNLKSIQEFLKQLNDNEGELPEACKPQFSDFKKNFGQIFVKLPEPKPEPLSENQNLPQAHQGAIAKRRPRASKPISNCDTIADETTEYDIREEFSDSSDSTEVSSRHTRFFEAAPNLGEWKPILDRLDSRKVADLNKFSNDSTISLDNYLRKFETYCKRNFKGERDSWVAELERHLEGKTLNKFLAIRDNDSYDVTKKKLIEWYNDMKEIRQEDNKIKFRNATIDENEDMNSFGTRLERLFKLAYPLRNVNSNRGLQDKYISAIPKSFSDILEGKLMDRDISGQQVTWDMMMKCARVYDLRCERRRARNETAKSTKDVVINITQGKKSMDAAVQCNSRNDHLTHFARHARPRQQFPSDLNNHGHHQHQRPSTHNSWQQSMQENNFDFRGVEEQCNYCKRFGHVIQNCRSKWKQCFICGSAEHFLRDCPSYTGSRRASPNTERSASQPPRYNRASRPSTSTRRHGSATNLTPQQPLNINALGQQW